MSIETKTVDKTINAHNSPIDRKVKKYFLYGSCDAFAYALHDIYGYSLFVVAHYYPDEDGAVGDTYYTIGHVVAGIPHKNIFFDVNGRNTEAELVATALVLKDNNPIATKLIQLTKNDIINEFGEYNEQDYIEAVALVKRHSSFYSDECTKLE